MRTREEALSYARSLPDVYTDAPFHDDNWLLIRRRDNRRTFLCIFERQGHIWLNLKCLPEMGVIFRGAYASILPAYHMNKEHWLSVILDGSVPEDVILHLIDSSYALVADKKKWRNAPSSSRPD